MHNELQKIALGLAVMQCGAFTGHRAAEDYYDNYLYLKEHVAAGGTAWPEHFIPSQWYQDRGPAILLSYIESAIYTPIYLGLVSAAVWGADNPDTAYTVGKTEGVCH